MRISGPEEQFNSKGQISLAGSCATNVDVQITGDLAAPVTAACLNGEFAIEVQLTGADGAKTIYVSQTAKNGQNASASRVFMKDTLPPVMSLITPAGGANLGASVAVQGSCEAGIQVVLAEGTSVYNVPCDAGSFSSTLQLKSADGALAVTATQTDKAGNQTQVSANVMKDTVAPVVAFTAPAAASFVFASATLTGTCESGLSVMLAGAGAQAPVTVACDNSAFSALVAFTAGEGNKEIQVSQTDAAGNKSMVSRTFARASDVGPAVAISAPAADSVFRTTITLTGTCQNGLAIALAGAGLLSPNNTTCTNGAFSVALTLTAGDGPKNVIVTQTSAAGVPGSASRTFVRDTTAPALTIASPAANTIAKDGVQLMGACENGLPVVVGGTGATAVNLTCANGAYSGAVAFSAGDGAKAVQVTQTDAAGNAGTVSRSFTRDSVAPAIAITAPAAGAQAETGVTLTGTCEGTFTVTASGAGLQSQATQACAAGAFSIPVLFSAGEGTKALQVAQTDAAGNTGSVGRSFTRIAPAPILDGVVLYAQNCAGCHGTLATSVKLNRTLAQLDGAIMTIASMQNLSFLSSAQRQAIITALTTSGSIPVTENYPGKYLPVDKAYACNSTDAGLSSQGIRRLSYDELRNTYAALFGAAATADSAVSSKLLLLPQDQDIELVEKFNNRIAVQGVYEVSKAVADYTFANDTRLNALMSGCAADPVATACKTSFAAFAKRAWRRPFAAAEKTDYETFIAGFTDKKEGLKLATVRLLMAPQFHQLMEINDASVTGGRIRLDAYEVASRLAYRLTQSPPDDQLLAAADAGQLTTAAQLRTHALRLVETAAARATFKKFVIGWLRPNTVADPSPLMKLATGIDAAGLLPEYKAEYDAWIDYVVFQQNGTFNDLMTKKVMFPSTSRLAQLFGVGQSASAVASPAERGGVLFRPLLLNSGKETSSPIPRGVRMRKELLCTNLPSPDGIIVNTRLNGLADYPPTMYSSRQIVTEVTNSAACLSCHSQINPVGFVFESFGPFGDVRTKEKVFSNGAVVAEHPVDTAVSNIPIPGRAPVSVTAPSQLAEALGTTPSVMRCYSQQIHRYTHVRNALANDGCGLNATTDVLVNGGTIKESLINNAIGEEIFWRAVAN